METVRAHSSARLVLGGGGFSVIARGMMQRLRPDYCVLGEGERPFAQLLEPLESGTTGPALDAQLEHIGNLHHWHDGQLVSNPPARDFVAMNALPVPDRRHVDPRHYERVGIDSVQTKRGCPLHCTYCTYPLLEGNRSRMRDPDAVVDEMLGAPKAVCEAMVRRTLDFIVDLEPYAAILMAWTDDDEAVDAELRKQRTAFRAQVLELLEDAQGSFPQWIIPPLRVNFDPRLFRWLRRQGMQGPLWQHTRMVPPAPPARVA